jgi:hypothetical protein
MFYLLQAVFIWILAVRFIEWRRLRSLLPYGFLGSFICMFQDRIGERFQLWVYRDQGLIHTHGEISTLISVSAAPLVAMWFIQGLQPEEAWPWKRILAFTLLGMLPELVALPLEKLIYGHGWSIAASVAAYVGLWSFFWWLHRWMERRGETPLS